MPHSLRAKLSGLRYKGILEDKDYKRLCKALDNEDVLEQIENDISHEIADIDESDFRRGVNIGLCHAIQYVRKYR